jgi:N4-gp56 family major capsid protein
MQAWTADTPTGPYRNNFLSEQLYEASFEKAEVILWVEPVEGSGKKRGDTVNLFTMTGPDEVDDGALAENIRIPELPTPLSAASFLIREFGKAVTWTNIWDDWAKYDLPAFVKKRLRENMRLTLDRSAGAAFKSASISFTPTSAGTVTIDTGTPTATPSVAASAAVGVTHLQLARDYAYGTLKAPYFGNGDAYIGIFNWASTRSIRTDPLFKEYYVLGHPEKLQRGEIGVVDNIRIVETNHDTVLQVVTSGGVNIGQGLVFGDESVAFAEAQTPELRMKIADDYGRSLGCAWYGQLGFGVFHPNPNIRESRIIRFSGNNFATP